ncbi:MAG: murein biosynthesis integral membrane protein MurJ [Cyclobacteriaceae bacterium]
MYKKFALIGIGSLIGKVIGLLREVILAIFLGTSKIVDGYRASLTATLLPVNLLLRDTLNAGFIPIYSSRLKRNKSIYFFQHTFILLVVLSLILTLLLILFRNEWSRLLVPGFEEQTQKLVTNFILVMAPGIPFFILSGLFSAVESSNQSYYLVSFRASLQSISLILGTLGAFYFSSPLLLGAGFSLAYFLFFFISLRHLFNKKFVTREYFTAPFNNNKFQENIRLLFNTIKPLLILTLIIQGNIWVERVTASNFDEVGVLASLEFARTLAESGIIIISYPLGLISLSTFSGLTKNDITKQVVKTVEFQILLFTPVSIAFIFLSKEVVELIFEYGSFNSKSTAFTAAMLKNFGFGLIFTSMAYYLVKVYNAIHQNKKVLLFTAVALFIQIGINVCLKDRIGSTVMALSNSIYGMVLFLLFGIDLKLFSMVEKKLLLNCALCVVLFVTFYYLFLIEIEGNVLKLVLFLFFWLAVSLLNPYIRKKIYSLKK